MQPYGDPLPDSSADEIDLLGNELSAAKEYEILQRVGGGTFGEVVKARHKASGRIVALKRVWHNDSTGGSGFGSGCHGGQPPAASAHVPPPLSREVQALQVVRHANVVQLHRTFMLNKSLVLEMDNCCTDLAVLLRAARAKGLPPPEPVFRVLLRQLLAALATCHAAGVLHRDVKPANLLLRAVGSLALADFGQARSHCVSGSGSATSASAAASGCNGAGRSAGTAPNAAAATNQAANSAAGFETGRPGYAGQGRDAAGSEGCYTAAVATRWYRAPELLLGCRDYGGGVDMWAAGCTFAELLAGAPLLPGESDIDQLARVAQLHGGISEAAWPGVVRAPDWGKLVFRPVPAVPLAERLPGAPAAAVALLTRMLALDPARRPSAAEALQDPYLAERGADEEHAATAAAAEAAAEAVAYADAERRRHEAELAAFEDELAALEE